MNTTKILGEAVGIQSQGIVDRTETQTNVGLTSAIIIGQFKRGRVDRPMVIHNGNIRGQLGHEPNNPYYNAVQDCLDTGVPSVQVLRVGGIDNGNVPIIGCEGATNFIEFTEFSGLWSLYIDNAFAVTGTKYEIRDHLNSLDAFTATIGDTFKIKNTSNVNHRFKIVKFEPLIDSIPENYTINAHYQNNENPVGTHDVNTQLPGVLAAGLDYSDSGMYSSKRWVEPVTFAHFFKIQGFVRHRSDADLKISSSFGDTYGLTRVLNAANEVTDFLFITYAEKNGSVGALFEIVNDAVGMIYNLSISVIDNPPHSVIADGNPTFIEHGDGSLTVCLAPLDEDLDLYTQTVLALNPKAYYLMSEESGNVVFDSSPSGFHGAIHDVDHVTYKQKIIRKGSTGALGFNLFEGAASIAECFVSDAIAGDFFRKLAGVEKSCTIAFWFEPVAIRNFNWMYAYSTDALWGESNYRAHSRGGQILAESPSDANTVNSDEALLDMLNKNHFVVWRKDAVTGKYALTVNEVTKTLNGESSPETVGTGFYFPMSAGFDNYGLRGYMSDMSVFDYALSDAQIANLYAKGKLA